MPTSAPVTAIDPGCSDTQRFELELEFVQCLASPEYLNWLAQSNQLKDPALIRFLEYLQYWLRPEYAAYIIYPHALFFLELLQSEEFRTALASSQVKELIHTQQFYHWLYYRRNRLAAAAGQQDPQLPQAQPMQQ